MVDGKYSSFEDKEAAGKHALADASPAPSPLAGVPIAAIPTATTAKDYIEEAVDAVSQFGTSTTISVNQEVVTDPQLLEELDEILKAEREAYLRERGDRETIKLSPIQTEALRTLMQLIEDEHSLSKFNALLLARMKRLSLTKKACDPNQLEEQLDKLRQHFAILYGLTAEL